MPEGPSLLHLADTLQPFIGKVVTKAGGYGPMETAWLEGKKLLNITTWGKHLLFVFTNGTVRVHLMLFGSILINKQKKVNRSFYMEFKDNEINGYVVKAEKLEGKPEDFYDWRTDILSKQFDKAYVKSLLKTQHEKSIDDVLMDQEIFTGVGNKIRNEALYRSGIHPLSIVGKIPAAKINSLITQVLQYAHIFYQNLKKKNKHDFFEVYQQEYAADGSEVTMKVLPRSKRKIFFSEHKQVLYE